MSGSFPESGFSLHATEDRCDTDECAQIVTTHLVEEVPTENGYFVPNEVYNKICVVERHGKTGEIGVAPLKGFGVKGGAVATSVAHDSHNMIVAGRQ